MESVFKLAHKIPLNLEMWLVQIDGVFRFVKQTLLEISPQEVDDFVGEPVQQVGLRKMIIWEDVSRDVILRLMDIIKFATLLQVAQRIGLEIPLQVYALTYVQKV
jgi:hypothetical protein